VIRGRFGILITSATETTDLEVRSCRGSADLTLAGIHDLKIESADAEAVEVGDGIYLRHEGR
jgi:hypothetical protein